MSLVREQFDATLEITVGTTKIMTLIIEDPETGEPVDLSDTDIYSTAKYLITKPDKSLVGPELTVTFVDRPTGVTEFLVPASTTILENAGNWLGTIQFINVGSLIIDQRKMNFNILS